MFENPLEFPSFSSFHRWFSEVVHVARKNQTVQNLPEKVERPSDPGYTTTRDCSSQGMRAVSDQKCRKKTNKQFFGLQCDKKGNHFEDVLSNISSLGPAIN